MVIYGFGGAARDRAAFRANMFSAADESHLHHFRFLLL